MSLINRKILKHLNIFFLAFLFILSACNTNTLNNENIYVNNKDLKKSKFITTNFIKYQHPNISFQKIEQFKNDKPFSTKTFNNVFIGGINFSSISIYPIFHGLKIYALKKEANNEPYNVSVSGETCSYVSTQIIDAYDASITVTGNANDSFSVFINNEFLTSFNIDEPPVAPQINVVDDELSLDVNTSGLGLDRWNLTLNGPNFNQESSCIVQARAHFDKAFINSENEGTYTFTISSMNRGLTLSKTFTLSKCKINYPQSFKTNAVIPENPCPEENNCNGKNILPNQIQTITNIFHSSTGFRTQADTTSPFYNLLDETTNNSLELITFDRKIQNLNTQIQNLTKKLNDNGFSIQAFNPQTIRDKINNLNAQISSLQSDKQNKLDFITNKLNDINSNNQNIINQSNILTESNDSLDIYNLSDFNYFKEKAEELKYDFEDYVNSENTYGLIESAKTISKELSLYNNLVSVYASGTLPENIDNNDELPQYQDEETNYDKIQKPRQLIKWLNNRIKAHTNTLEIKRAKLDNNLIETQQQFNTQKDEYFTSLNELENESEKLSQLLDTLENDLGEDNNFSTQGFNTKSYDPESVDRFNKLMERRQAKTNEHRQWLRDNIPPLGAVVDQILDPTNFVPLPVAKPIKTVGTISKPVFDKFIGPLSKQAWDKLFQTKGPAYATNAFNQVSDSLILMGNKGKKFEKSANKTKNITDKALDSCKSQACRPGNAKFTSEQREQRIVDYLQSKGIVVKKNPMEGQIGAGRQPDFIVEGTGQRLELKTLGVESEPNIKTIENSLNKSVRSGGQARDMIYDARNTILKSPDTATEWITKGMNSSQKIKERIDSVRIVGDGFDFTLSRVNSNLVKVNN